MPKPLPPIISESKPVLVGLFRAYLLPATRRSSMTTPASKSLIEEIIIHKSFGAAFTYEIRHGMKPAHVTSAISKLADAICGYISVPPVATQIDYDEWLKAVGEGFLRNCLSYRSFEFGKAQKIINVTMKHLYCYNIAEDYFKYCHVALDSMTYTGRPSNSLDGGFFKYEVNHGATTKSFSNLTYDEYIQIQMDIRDYLMGCAHHYVDCSTGRPLTPFKAEFYIWPRYKR